MPIYEYACQACGHTFEELIRRKSDEEDLKCGGCGATAITRLMSASAVLGGGCGGSDGGGGGL
ncbi:MAG: zinc ribbon domain-containing protein [Deltaproteobacteria bacterium]|nr:zinc ribbon domain-containing protein [Deltaproteobacteria bacterium]